MVVGIDRIQEITGLERRKVIKLLETKGCPTLPRIKGCKYLIDEDAFREWLKRGGK